MDLQDWKEMTPDRKLEALLGMVAALRDSLVEMGRSANEQIKNLSDNDQKIMTELMDQRGRLDTHGKAIGALLDAAKPAEPGTRTIH